MILDVYCHLNKSATSFQVVFLLYAKCDIFLKCLHVLILFKLTAIVNKIRVKYTIICSNKWIHLYNYVQSFIKTMKGGGGLCQRINIHAVRVNHNCFLNSPTWQFFFTSVTIIKKPTIPPPPQKKIVKDYERDLQGHYYLSYNEILVS